MIGILAHPESYYPDATKIAYEIADAMIAEAAKRLGVGEDDDEEKEPPQPIGKCPKCGAPQYTTEGFCGGCHVEGRTKP